MGAGIGRLIGPVLIDGEFSIRGYSSQYLRGDESNQRPQIPGYTMADLTARVNYQRYHVEVEINNLFDRRFTTFGIEAQNSLGPYGASTPPVNPVVVPFLTPAFPRSITVSVGATL